MNNASVCKAAPQSQARFLMFPFWEKVSLQNRLDRTFTLPVHCCLYQNRYYVLIHSDGLADSRRLEKSADNIVQQLVDRIAGAPETVTFMLMQGGELPRCWRWNFQWVGNSPLKGNFSEFPIVARDKLLDQVLDEGSFCSLLNGDSSQVA